MFLSCRPIPNDLKFGFIFGRFGRGLFQKPMRISPTIHISKGAYPERFLPQQYGILLWINVPSKTFMTHDLNFSLLPNQNYMVPVRWQECFVSLQCNFSSMLPCNWGISFLKEHMKTLNIIPTHFMDWSNPTTHKLQIVTSSDIFILLTL